MPDLLERLKSALADRYVVERELGRGGMATVFLAQDLKHGRKVAVKVFLPELAASLGTELFLREIETAARLQHPHILPLYDSGEADGLLYYVMPYVEGESLHDRIDREGQLPIEEALRVAREVADGLSYAHSENVIHRDIKPGNIMLSRGHAMIADFGIAQAVDEAGGERLTRTGVSTGSPVYMSPEQARAAGGLDGRTDIYSLGCVLYEMLAGEPPFTGGTQASITARKELEATPRIRALRDTVPPPVEEAIVKVLAKVPADRFATADEFSVALQVPLQSPRKTLGLGTPLVRIALALGLLLGALGVGWTLLGDGGRGPEVTDRSIAVLPFETLGYEEANTFTKGVHGDLLTRLSHISGLDVTSRISVMRYESLDKSLRVIAEELGVVWILSGEVQETVDQVQVSARLVNARTDRQVWADSYRSALTAEDLFQVQAEITRQIAQALETRLSPQEERQVEQTPTVDLEAYRLYWQGRQLLDQRTAQGLNRALDYFQRTIAADSSYALAWVGLADALLLTHAYGHAAADSVLLRAENAVRRALELDPESAEAHASLGLLHSERREGPAAIRNLERAVELRPGYAEAHNWLSWVHLLLGNREESLESAERAVELDPRSHEAVSNLSLSYLANGEYEEALAEARRVNEIQTSWETGRFFEGLSLYHLGRFAEARSVFEGLETPWAGSGTPATLALIAIASGDTAEAQDLLALMEESDGPFAAGLVLAALGDEDAAFEAFERIDRWSDWPTLSVRHLYDPVWAPLRDDPRFEELVGEVDRTWGLEGGGGR
jgi:serine/threonine protein kinase/Flp pilus assembly protein TadD